MTERRQTLEALNIGDRTPELPHGARSGYQNYFRGLLPRKFSIRKVRDGWICIVRVPDAASLAAREEANG